MKLLDRKCDESHSLIAVKQEFQKMKEYDSICVKMIRQAKTLTKYIPYELFLPNCLLDMDWSM